MLLVDTTDDPFFHEFCDDHLFDGPLFDDRLLDDELELYFSEIQRDEQLEAEKHEARLDAYEADLYARLERPRKVKQKPLPIYHHKTWGHGNSRELINRVGQFHWLHDGHEAR